ncbi:MAG: hypothetical protein HOP29_05780 [Phycisphaerales bacterium]|nr:hypothetical protein [Phycisphaerales bacterium]
MLVRNGWCATVAIVLAASARAAPPVVGDAAEFTLITGVDAGISVGTMRNVVPVPGPGFAGPVFDGDRLAGTSDAGGAIVFEGDGEPLFAPNAFGALSFTFRRGTIPIPGGSTVPILGIDYLGGPLLDLDGNLNNGSRSLVPVFGQTPVVILGTSSHVDFSFDWVAGAVELARVDMTSTNPGGPDIQAEIATTVNVLAGTSNNGTPGDPINPSFDTRLGALTAFPGASGQLHGVYRIDELGYEIWQDSIDPFSSTPLQLGTIQFLGTFRGWLVTRPRYGGQFPTLSGEGLGGPLWPAVNADDVGAVIVTANGLQGGSTLITDGSSRDRFSVCQPAPGPCNGGMPLTDFGGDLGAYLDAVVVPLLSADQHSFVYLESAGVGVNNSNDPVFGDTNAADVVIIAASLCGSPLNGGSGDFDANGVIGSPDFASLHQCVGTEVADFDGMCAPGDLNNDGAVDLIDFGRFQTVFGLSVTSPACEL